LAYGGVLRERFIEAGRRYFNSVSQHRH
jgi:hypothetical protein